MGLFFLCINKLPLTTMYSIIFFTPFVLTIGSVIFLKEKVSWRRYTAILVGFIGTIIAIDPFGKEINNFYSQTNKLLVVGLLRGSFIFIADLVRELKIPVEVDFITASSYGNSMESSQNIRILNDLNTDIKDFDVLLVEDIIDTGHTLSQVVKLLKNRKPKSLEVCCLLNKFSRRFVVGYGIDYAQDNRHLPFIGKVAQ